MNPIGRLDSRADQARRVADFLELRPGSSAKAIDAATDCGSITKVLSDMQRSLGYELSKRDQTVFRSDGTRRRMRVYFLRSRPGSQADLFEAA